MSKVKINCRISKETNEKLEYIKQNMIHNLPVGVKVSTSSIIRGALERFIIEWEKEQRNHVIR